MIPLVGLDAVGLSSRLPVVLQPRRHRRRRPPDVGHRQPGPSVHPRRHLRQGARVRRARPLTAPCVEAAAPCRAEGHRRLRSDLVGRRGGDDRRALAGDHRGRRRRGDPALLVRRLDGAGAVLRGPPALPRPRREPARSLDLRHDGLRRVAGHRRRRHRQRLRADGGRRPGRALGRERVVLDDQRDDAREGGAGARCARRRDRSVPDADRSECRRAPDGAAGYRRGSGARGHARAGGRGPDRSGVHRAGDRRLRSARRAPARVLARGRRAHRRARGRHDRELRAPLRRLAPHVHPGRDRPVPPRERRDDLPHARVPARADRRLRRPARRRAAVDRRRVRLRLFRARASRPDAHAGPADHQHDPARAGPDGS